MTLTGPESASQLLATTSSDSLFDSSISNFPIEFKRDLNHNVFSNSDLPSSTIVRNEYSFYMNVLPDKHSTPYRSLFCDTSSFSHVDSIAVLINGVVHPLSPFKDNVYHCNIFFYPGTYTLSFFVNDELFLNPLYDINDFGYNTFSTSFLSYDEIYFKFLIFVFSPLCLTSESYLFYYMKYRQINKSTEPKMGYMLNLKYFLPILKDYDFIHIIPGQFSEDSPLNCLPNNAHEFFVGDEEHKVWVEARDMSQYVQVNYFEPLKRREVRELYAEVYPINEDPDELIEHFSSNFLFKSNEEASSFVDEPYLIFDDRLYLITRDFFSDDVCDDDIDSLDINRHDNSNIEEQLKNMIDSPKQTVKIPLSDQYKQNMLHRLKQQLPIFLKYNEILDRVDSEKVCVLVGSTGCGKSTQLPVYLAELYSNSGKKIAITQPCNLAAMTLYNRISDEYEVINGRDGAGQPICSNIVGYLTNRGAKQGSQIMVMEQDKLFSYDPLLSEFSVLIIDEVHIRSISTDIILGLARDILRKRPDFRVVVCSATIDTSKYINYFFGDNSSILPISVPGRVFDVRVVENPVDPNALLSQLPLIVKEAIVNPAYYENGECIGHVLVFVPSKQSVGKCMELFKKACKGSDDYNNVVCRALHETIEYVHQKEVIEFDKTHTNKRMVCFCTSIAETSLTVPNVRMVIDSGLTVRSTFDDVSRSTLIETVLISKSSSEQRKGRCGRTCPGVFIPLYNYNDPKRVEYDPDILTSSVDLLSLKMMSLGFDPETFKFIDSPPHSISNAIVKLKELDCINNQNELKSLGKIALALQIDPRRIYFSYLMAQEGLLSLGAIITAILSTNNPLILDKLEFYDCSESIKSDLLSLVLVYQKLTKTKRQSFPVSVNKTVFSSIKSLSRSIVSSFRKIDELDKKNSTEKIAFKISLDSDTISVLNNCLLASFGNSTFTTVPDVSNVLVSNDQSLVLEVHPLSFFMTTLPSFLVP
ncbi:hypothetical protein GEMRC1_011697 [Eukaryota sp. GEM-RC1]